MSLAVSDATESISHQVPTHDKITAEILDGFFRQRTTAAMRAPIERNTQKSKPVENALMPLLILLGVTMLNQVRKSDQTKAMLTTKLP